MRLQGKIAVITGGASGIGGEATKLFAAEGATVIMLDVKEAEGKALEQALTEQGLSVKFLRTDISDPAQVQASMAEIDRLYGRLDVLYNNASVYLGGREAGAEDLDVDVWKKVLSINLDGLFYCCKYALPIMKRTGGAIVNTASSAAVVGVPGCAGYTATKGATVALTRSMAVDYGKYNIRVNCIAPAAILTEMVKESNLNDPSFDNDFFIRQITPLKRWGTPQDIAQIACFLSSDDASYINGAILTADGGITINGTVNPM